MLTAQQALELGFVDRVVEPERLVEEAISISADELAREDADLSETAEVVARARRQLDDMVHGAAPAPYRALDLIEGAAGWSIEEGYRAEEEALADLLFTPQAQASLYAFDLVERRARRGAGRPATEPRDVKKVGIAGAGLMATQLATLFLRRLGVPVVLRDLEQEIIDRALETIRDDLAAAAARGRLDPQEAVSLAALAKGTTSYDGFEDCDFVLEAIFEELGVKQQLFGELEAVVPAECVLATNTSALSVTAMADGLRASGTPRRDALLQSRRRDAARRARPHARDGRCLARDDVGRRRQAPQAARARERRARFRRQPAADQDDGRRPRARSSTATPSTRPTRPFSRSACRWRRPCSSRWSGRRVEPRARDPARGVPRSLPALADARELCGGRRRLPTGAARSVEEIREAALAALADEVAHLLEEGVVASPKDVDTALILGAGFPFFMGGLTPYLARGRIFVRTELSPSPGRVPGA